VRRAKEEAEQKKKEAEAKAARDAAEAAKKEEEAAKQRARLIEELVQEEEEAARRAAAAKAKKPKKSGKKNKAKALKSKESAEPHEESGAGESPIAGESTQAGSEDMEDSQVGHNEDPYGSTVEELQEEFKLNVLDINAVGKNGKKGQAGQGKKVMSESGRLPTDLGRGGRDRDEAERNWNRWDKPNYREQQRQVEQHANDRSGNGKVWMLQKAASKVGSGRDSIDSAKRPADAAGIAWQPPAPNSIAPQNPPSHSASNGVVQHSTPNAVANRVGYEVTKSPWKTLVTSEDGSRGHSEMPSANHVHEAQSLDDKVHLVEQSFFGTQGLYNEGGLQSSPPSQGQEWSLWEQNVGGSSSRLGTWLGSSIPEQYPLYGSTPLATASMAGFAALHDGENMGSLGENVATNGFFRQSAAMVEIEQAMLCPISHKPMSDPVVCADGHTYQRGHIEEWLLRNNTSPVTGKPLLHMFLVPNHALINVMNAWDQMR